MPQRFLQSKVFSFKFEIKFHRKKTLTKNFDMHSFEVVITNVLYNTLIFKEKLCNLYATIYRNAMKFKKKCFLFIIKCLSLFLKYRIFEEKQYFQILIIF